MHTAFPMPFSMRMQHAMPRARILSASETIPAPSPAWPQPARRHRCTQHACLCMHSFLHDMEHCHRHSCSMPCRVHAYCARMGPISAMNWPSSMQLAERHRKICIQHAFFCMHCSACHITSVWMSMLHGMQKKKRCRRSRPDLRAGARNVP